MVQLQACHRVMQRLKVTRHQVTNTIGSQPFVLLMLNMRQPLIYTFCSEHEILVSKYLYHQRLSGRRLSNGEDWRYFQWSQNVYILWFDEFCSLCVHKFNVLLKLVLLSIPDSIKLTLWSIRRFKGSLKLRSVHGQSHWFAKTCAVRILRFDGMLKLALLISPDLMFDQISTLRCIKQSFLPEKI